MINRGFTSNLWVWMQRYSLDERSWQWKDLLRDCAEAGLDAVELNSDQLESKYKLVQDVGLTVSASYIGLQLHEEGLAIGLKDQIVPVAELLAGMGGTNLLVNADMPAGLLKTDDDFKRQGEHLSIIAELLQPYNIKTAMHNHASEKHNAEGDLRSVTEYSSPSVGLCVDTGWALTSDCDPVDWVKRYPERVHALHLRNQYGSVPTEDLLEGDLSMPAFMQALRDASYDGWFSMELWHRKDMNIQRTLVEDYRRSIAYLKTLM